MDWNEFWELIDAAVDDPEVVRKRLKTLSEQDLVDFFWRLEERADQFMEDKYAVNLEEPYSEDYWEDIAHWVVRQGEKFYEDVVFEPSKFPGEIPDDDDISYTTMAGDEYYERYGVTMRGPEEPPPAKA